MMSVENMSAENRSQLCVVCSFNPKLEMVQESRWGGFGTVQWEKGGGKKTQVRWICLLPLLRCYDQSNEICGDLGLSFCCITHTLSCTRNPLWNCPQTHPLGWMHSLMFQTTEHHSVPFYGLHPNCSPVITAFFPVVFPNAAQKRTLP